MSRHHRQHGTERQSGRQVQVSGFPARSGDQVYTEKWANKRGNDIVEIMKGFQIDVCTFRVSEWNNGSLILQPRVIDCNI